MNEVEDRLRADLPVLADALSSGALDGAVILDPLVVAPAAASPATVPPLLATPSRATPSPDAPMVVMAVPARPGRRWRPAVAAAAVALLGTGAVLGHSLSRSARIDADRPVPVAPATGEPTAPLLSFPVDEPAPMVPSSWLPLPSPTGDDGSQSGPPAESDSSDVITSAAGNPDPGSGPSTAGATIPRSPVAGAVLAGGSPPAAGPVPTATREQPTAAPGPVATTATTIQVPLTPVPTAPDIALSTTTVRSTTTAGPISTPFHRPLQLLNPGQVTVSRAAFVTIVPLVVGGDGTVRHWTGSGLPYGLAVSASTGRVTGRTYLPGVYSVSLVVSDATARSNQGFTLVVR